MKATPKALKVLKIKKNIDVLSKHSVLSEKEIASRYEINKHAYHTVITLEGDCALTMARTGFIPAGLEYQAQLAAAKTVTQKKLLKTVSGLVDDAIKAADALEAALVKHDAAKIN